MYRKNKDKIGKNIINESYFYYEHGEPLSAD